MANKHWRSLGDLNPEFGSRAWFSTQRRLTDNAWYLFAGSTTGLNSVLKWDGFRWDTPSEQPPIGRWVYAKRGPGGYPAAPSFPDVGAFYPNGGDNGFTVWDNVHDEMWVNAPERANNLGGQHADPGIWNPNQSSLPGDPFPTGGRWRGVTTAEFPDLATVYAGQPLAYRLKWIFNPSSAGGPTTSILYGGDSSGGGANLSDLKVYIPGNGAGNQWKEFLGQGGSSSGGDASGPGLVSPSGQACNLLRWSRNHNVYIMYRNGKFWTMPEGTISGGWTWTQMVTSGSTAGMPGGSCTMLALDECQRLVVLGNTGDPSGASDAEAGSVWVIDDSHAGTTGDPWPITKLTMTGTPPWVRNVGIWWNHLNTVYAQWGSESSALWSAPGVPLVGGLRATWAADGIASLSPVTGSWIAIPHGAATLGMTVGVGAEMKHVAHSVGGPSGKTFFHGGDYPSAGTPGQSYQQKNFSHIMAAEIAGRSEGDWGQGWVLESGYCTPPRPKHPDKVGVHWDAARGVFWQGPGASEFFSVGGDICTGETGGAYVSDPDYPLNCWMFYNPSASPITIGSVTADPGKWALYDTNSGPNYGPYPTNTNSYLGLGASTYSVFDPVGDQILTWSENASTYGVRVVHYHLATKAYTWQPLDSGGYGFNEDPLTRDGSSAGTLNLYDSWACFDPIGRKLYAGCYITGRFYQYDPVTFNMTRLANLPGGGLGSTLEFLFLAWDSVNARVLFYRLAAPTGLHAYDPVTNLWTGNYGLTTQIPGVSVTGLVFWYDAVTNIVALMGQTPISGPGNPSGTRYLFVTRIGALVGNPIPFLSLLTPSTTTVGGPAFLLTLTGSGFVPGATVNFNGVARASVYVSDTSIFATIAASEILLVGTYPVTATNPTPGGGTSNTLLFSVTVSANPIPTLTVLVPTSMITGSPDTVVTAMGTNFIATTVANWDGAVRTTVIDSATQLRMTVTATDLLSVGVHSITATNPTPGGGISNSLTFSVDLPPTFGQTGIFVSVVM